MRKRFFWTHGNMYSSLFFYRISLRARQLRRFRVMLPHNVLTVVPCKWLRLQENNSLLLTDWPQDEGMVVQLHHERWLWINGRLSARMRTEPILWRMRFLVRPCTREKILESAQWDFECFLSKMPLVSCTLPPRPEAPKNKTSNHRIKYGNIRSFYLCDLRDQVSINNIIIVIMIIKLLYLFSHLVLCYSLGGATIFIF